MLVPRQMVPFSKVTGSILTSDMKLHHDLHCISIIKRLLPYTLLQSAGAPYGLTGRW